MTQDNRMGHLARPWNVTTTLRPALPRADPDEEFRAFVAARSPALLRTACLLAGGDWALGEDLLQAAL